MPASCRGVNVSGGYVQWEDGVTPVEGTSYQWVTTDDLDYLAARVGFIRLLFSWELLQPTAAGPFDPAYHAKMQNLVTHATGKGLNVLIEPHGEVDTAFARYKGHLVGSPEVPNAVFADLWQRVALAYGGNVRVMFGLSNEPNNMSTVQWFAAAQAAVTAIRGAGATNLIFVPGNGYSQPSGWTGNWYDTAPVKVSNAAAWTSILSDPLKRLVVSVHTYFDSTGGGVNQNEIVSTTVIRDRLQPVVDWARPLGLKVHLSEFGCNKITPNALTAVTDAIAYMDANCDVMLGWSWWTYGPKDWWGDYAFTLCYDHIDAMGNKVDDVKMTWLSPHAGVTALPHIADNAADSGAEPNVTTSHGWESPDITVAQVGGGDGTTVNPIVGGSPATVSVKFSNRGTGPTDTARVVRLYWAKANLGLSWPYPGNPTPSPWQAVTPSRQLPPLVACGASGSVDFDWTPPDPAAYGGDDHFCLLACVAAPEDPDWVGFSGTDLNVNVLNMRAVAWRNIHIIAVQKKQIGNIVASNFHADVMHAWVEIELFDRLGRRMDLGDAGLLLSPQHDGLRRLSGAEMSAQPVFETTAHDSLRLFGGASGFAIRELKPGENVTVGLAFESAPPRGGYVLRATQYSVSGTVARPIGGQTFVAGRVKGFMAPRPRGEQSSLWRWATGSALTMVGVAMAGGLRPRRG